MQPADAAKMIKWSRTVLRGLARIEQPLVTRRQKQSFYRDVKVLAYPLRHGAALAAPRGCRGEVGELDGALSPGVD